MPRAPRAKAEAEPDEVDWSAWLDAADANKLLQMLCGHWRDTMGSRYRLRLDAEGVMEVQTTRPRGRVMRTRGLIHIQWQNHSGLGRVVWGRTGARALFTISKLDDESLSWQSNRSKPFHWHREEAPDDEEEEEEAEEDEEEEDEEEEPGGDTGSREDWAWTGRRRRRAWDAGWDECWEEGWGEHTWEEDDEWANEAQYETASATTKRRAELRKKFQETYRVVEALTGSRQETRLWTSATGSTEKGEKVETSAKRWKEPVYKKVQNLGDGEDGAASEVLKSMLGIRTEEKARKGAKGRKEKACGLESARALAMALASSLPSIDSGLPSCAQQAYDQPAVAPAAPQDGAAKGPDEAQDAGQSAEEEGKPAARLEAQATPSSSAPVSPVGQEQRAPIVNNNGREVGERLLQELCQGVGGKADKDSAFANANVVQVNRLETMVQGFLGQPGGQWCQPPPQPGWMNGQQQQQQGWAFDIRWVTSTLEWYFSDVNLCGDMYLRSNMMPDEGWVPLIFLLTFPRLQTLGVNHAILGQAAMVSQSLEMDTTGHYMRIRDKKRRAQWLPVQPVRLQ